MTITSSTSTEPSRPAAPGFGRGVGMAVRYWLAHYAQTWRGTMVSSFVEPLLYLLAFGLGVGTLIDASTAGGQGLGSGVDASVDYLSFLAPGLLAGSLLTGIFSEAAWSVLGGVQYWFSYKAQSATPLTAWQIIVGHQVFMGARSMLGASAFVLVMAGFGTPRSWLVLLCVPLAPLVAWSISAPMAAFSVSRTRDAAFPAIFRFIVQPMFLFSGTFFTVDQFPAALAWLARAIPLWHGVQLFRSLSLGTAELWPSVAHSCYLIAWIAVGLVLCRFTYGRRLQT